MVGATLRRPIQIWIGIVKQHHTRAGATAKDHFDPFPRPSTGHHWAGIAHALSPIFTAPGIFPSLANFFTQVRDTPTLSAARDADSNSVGFLLAM